MSIGSDITDRKRAEEQVQRLHDDLRLHADTLEEQVAVRTAELAAINDKIAGLVSPLAEKKNIELQISLSDIPVMITTDQRRLEQVILNLMNNAIKFTEIGHVGVTLRSEKKYFLLSFTDTGHLLCHGWGSGKYSGCGCHRLYRKTHQSRNLYCRNYGVFTSYRYLGEKAA